MLNFLRKLMKPKYATLNKLEIKAAHIISNYNYLKSRQPAAEIFPVLKANAYGHGLKEVAKIINRTAAPLVVVDSFPEAQIVYRYFKRKVLILGEMPLRAYRYSRFARTEFVIYNEATLRHLARFGKKVKIHLFVNSGMNREGIQDLKSFIATNKKYLDQVEVTGLCSHLASAEQISPLNQRQEAEFISALADLRAAGYFPRWVHLGNSAAVFTLHNPLLTAYRPGLALYGYSPFSDSEFSSISEGDGEEAKLKPALQVFSHIVSIQDLKAGESVSYNETYRANAPTRIAVIPFGYFEGLDRRLTSQASFSVISQATEFWAPVAGRVCMNLTCLQIGYREVAVGDIVKIISDNPRDPNSIANLSALIGTIPYEFLVKLQSNIRREIV
jgi:alanine racemase